ncbi:MAG: hypothetical protein IKC50_07490, partial [Oscillospiraceae bacterium]|nr:hypothetical protein [Oscillospiraceae bacterium]
MPIRKRHDVGIVPYAQVSKKPPAIAAKNRRRICGAGSVRENQLGVVNSIHVLDELEHLVGVTHLVVVPG